MNPISTPVTPPIPAETQYPASRLNLFVEYDRASYKSAFGIDPPSYDTTKPTKAWFDTSGASSDYSALVERASVVIYGSVDLGGLRADQVNLYGLHSYEKYVPRPTQATHGGQPIAARYMSTKQEAWQLARDLGVDDQFFEDEAAATQPYFYPADEDRRVYNVKWNGELRSVGVLIEERNFNGVGSPGHWDLSLKPEPYWISEMPTALQKENPRVPVPQRPLDSSESIRMQIGGAYVITRGEDSTGTGGGGLSAEQDRKLSAIYAEVVKQAA